jgi:hypothetical protein
MCLLSGYACCLLVAVLLLIYRQIAVVTDVFVQHTIIEHAAC